MPSLVAIGTVLPFMFRERKKMNYREYIFEACEETDFNDKDDVIALVQFLANELMDHFNITIMQEKKLKSVLTAEEWDTFATECGKELFKDGVERLPESDFKEFVKDNMDLILEGEEQ